MKKIKVSLKAKYIALQLEIFRVDTTWKSIFSARLIIVPISIIKRILKFDRKIFRITACRGQPSELKWHNNLRRAWDINAWVIRRCADSQTSRDYQIANALRLFAHSVESFKLLLYPCPPSTHVSSIIFSIYHIYCSRDGQTQFQIVLLTSKKTWDTRWITYS